MDNKIRPVILDKNHGFMKSIIKNQVERQNFDRDEKIKNYLRSSEASRNGCRINLADKKVVLENNETNCIRFTNCDVEENQVINNSTELVNEVPTNIISGKS